ncbi:unnamed protein product, partial [Ixodes pacificus]
SRYKSAAEHRNNRIYLVVAARGILLDTMLTKVLLFCFVAYVASQAVENYPPQPYTFNVDNTDENGTRITQEETGDENNVKTGSYSYTDPFGMQRTVKYVADATGFHVTIETNEPGTKTSNPADAQIISSSVEAPAPAPVVVKPAPVVVKTVQQAPVTVHAVHTSPVVHAIQAPISYAAPITYDTAHHVSPIAVSLSHAPLTYTLGAAKSA